MVRIRAFLLKFLQSFIYEEADAHVLLRVRHAFEDFDHSYMIAKLLTVMW